MPKSSLQWAFKAGIIALEEEPLWASMLQDRNLSSHTYRSKLAQEIAERIELNYEEAIGKALKRLEKLIPLLR